AHLGMVATVVDEVSIAGLELGDDSGVIAVAGIDAFEHDDIHASFLQLVPYSRGYALTIGLLVVQHRDFLGLDLFNDELGGGGALLVIAADGAENRVVVLAV